MANNPISPPLPADLPDNWVYGETVAPSGLDAGLTEQHGYNYLMKQVNKAQKGVNTLGEALVSVAKQSDLDTHVADATKHITATERTTWSGKAVPSTSVTGTLAVAGWAGTGPYTQTLAVAGLGSLQNGDIGLAQAATAEQRAAARDAMLSVTAQTAGALTITADGVKPTVNIPVSVTILG